ncbi:MAG TPA: bifunctional rhamnulose-1-phosphate aldolase/short-chain dehydrogenase [Opitutaceae bacterium]|jgi:rhamnulose-1-phosphate aldolase/alcohol dehydrogenase|nr:bifunctional rhamnulose-1-phosphate aldolase/short-chain dehydrogenase [Opitutaceae bacterium]
MKNTLKHVNYLWDDAKASSMDPVARLIYRSNILGDDQRITNSGGGNTSSKLPSKDPLTGKTVEVLWVKGSGGDLRTSTRENFSSLYQDKVMGLKHSYVARADRGLKSPAEDDMVGMFAHATFNLNPRAPSIDTSLHSFLPGVHVDHMHPNAIIAIAASENAERLTKEIFAGKMAYVPWMRPGFELGIAMQDIVRADPQVRAIMMGKHGFISWADDDKECYELTLALIEKAALHIEATFVAKGGDRTAFGGAKFGAVDEAKGKAVLASVLPWLRGRVSAKKRVIGTVQSNAAILRFVNSSDAARLAELGTSCPDHFLRTKIKPLYVDWDPKAGDVADLKAKLDAGLEAYRKDYAAYYSRCRHPDSPAMRDPNPTVILIPGIGIIAWGKDKSESRVTAEFYTAAIEVMRGAEAIDKYSALPQQEAFDIEYWLLEEAKLKRMPAEKELARQVVVVVGAGSGIGREVALRLSRDGAHVVCVDMNADNARETAKMITDKLGMGIGIAGSGLAACGPAVGLRADVTDRSSIRAMLDEVAMAYGGFDSICVTAGVFVPSDTSGHIPDDKWPLNFAVNVTGSYLVADEAAKTWKDQGLSGSLVLTTSANGVVAKRGSLAYDTSKAAANHLVRELAIEMAPLVRVNGVAPATVVQGSAMFPRERVIGSLAKYKIPYADDEATEALTGRLAQFYADRTLTKAPITTADQAEAYFLLVSGRLSKTTGQIVPVDGGLSEAFLR